MKLFLVNIWKYIAIFFAGIIAALVYAITQINPNVINADTYNENFQQRINKLKQRGEGNEQTTSFEAEPTGREKRKLRRQKRREQRLVEDTAKEEEEQKNY